MAKKQYTPEPNFAEALAEMTAVAEVPVNVDLAPKVEAETPHIAEVRPAPAVNADPWWECVGNPFPKKYIQAPNGDAASMEYMRYFKTTRVRPVVSQVK